MNSRADATRAPLRAHDGPSQDAPMPPQSFMPSSPPVPVDTHQLLHELEMAHRHLVQHALATTQEPLPQETGSMLAVARLIPGMDKGSWERLRNLLPQHGWCALEVCVHTATATVCSTVLADCLPNNTESDPLTGALLTAPLLQQLEREVVRAARGQSPLSVVAFALNNSWAQQHGESAVHAAALALSRAVQCHCLSCDSLGRLDMDNFALILPGAGLFKAQALVEEVLTSCVSCDTAPPFVAGIAGSTGNACQCTALLDQANDALQQAKDSGECVRVYRAQVHPLVDRRTLVQSHEKRFLFSGGD